MLTVKPLDIAQPDIQKILPSARYLPHCITYRCAYLETWSFEATGFMLYAGENMLAAFICSAGKTPEGKVSLSAWGIPAIFLRSPLLQPEYWNEVRNITKKHLQQLFMAYPNSTFLFEEYPSPQGLSPVATILLDAGNTPENMYAIAIPLCYPEDILWSHIRKRYKSLIHKGEREFQCRLIDANTVTKEDIEAFRLLHKSVSGRSTRSHASWIQQFEAIKANEAFSVFLLLEGNLVGASYFLCGLTRCYYGVGAYRRELFDRPVAHVALWQAIREAKRRGCAFFDVGRWHAKTSNAPEKEQNISHFKRGFGGITESSLLFSVSANHEMLK